MDSLLFGAAYYPEYMPYERTETDLFMMKKAGMNVVRIAESTWSTLERTDGEFDFSYIDKVLSVAENLNMSVIIGTPTYAVPSWLVKKEPEIMVERKDGRADYGSRQLIDFMNPVFRIHAERVIRKLMERTAENLSVIGFQIANETKHYGNCGKYVQELFVSRLKEKFKTTDNLNLAFNLNFWSNSIHDWNDFPDMKGCCNGGLASEFSAFRRTLAAEYLNWQSNIVREYKRDDQFITHNFDFEWKKFGADIAQDGYSYGSQPDINHYEASGSVTVAGVDIYHPTQDKLTGTEIAFCSDAVRCLKNDNYIVLETQAQAFKYWTPYPNQLRLHAYSHLAGGAEGILYWNWHSIRNGYETYWRGILSHDLKENATYRDVFEIGNEFVKIKDTISGLRKENKVAVVVDTHSLDALKWFPIDKKLSYNNVLRWMYDSLYEMNVECDVVDVNALMPEKYSMIITPALYSVSEETIAALKDFVKNGGVLFSTFRCFVADRCLSVYLDAQPYGLSECFGMSYQQFTEPDNMSVDGAEVKYFAELLMPDTAEVIASYEHKYWGNYAAITKNKYGNGTAYYVGTYLKKKQLKDVLKKALRDAGIKTPAYKFPVILKNGINKKGEILHFILYYDSSPTEIKCPYNAVDVLGGMHYRKGDVLKLTDWDAVLLKEI